jgi:hypothetical protein
MAAPPRAADRVHRVCAWGGASPAHSIRAGEDEQGDSGVDAERCVGTCVCVCVGGGGGDEGIGECAALWRCSRDARCRTGWPSTVSRQSARRVLLPTPPNHTLAHPLPLPGPVSAKPRFLSGRTAVVWARDYSAEDQAACDCDALQRALRAMPGAQRMVVRQGAGVRARLPAEDPHPPIHSHTHTHTHTHTHEHPCAQSPVTTPQGQSCLSARTYSTCPLHTHPMSSRTYTRAGGAHDPGRRHQQCVRGSGAACGRGHVCGVRRRGAGGAGDSRGWCSGEGADGARSVCAAWRSGGQQRQQQQQQQQQQ